MFAGGSNGIRNGALINDQDHHYHPVVSSYDYDALIDESGRLTPKYHAIRNLIQKNYPQLIDESLSKVILNF